MAEGPTKTRICRACGKDCAGQPRIKDAKGRYLHKACYEKAKARAAAKANGANAAAAGAAAGASTSAKPVHESAPEPAFEPGFDGPDDLAIEAPVDPGMFGESSTPQVTTTPCPDCGHPTARGTVICTSCGHNFLTGESGGGAKIKKPSKIAGAAEGAAGSALSVFQSGAMGWILTFGLPLMVGLICAVVWAYTFYSLGHTRGVFLVGIGVAVGLSLKFVGGEGFIGGLISGALTLCSIGLGIVLVGQLYTGEELFTGTSDPLAEYVTANDARFYLADWIAYEREEAGETLNYPAGFDFYTAEFLEHFPEDVQEEAKRRWAAMEPYEQHDTRAAALFSEHDAKVRIADGIIEARYDRGEAVNWPSSGVIDVEFAYYPRDFPADVWAEAESEWASLASNVQQDRLSAGRRETAAFYDEVMEAMASASSSQDARAGYRFLRSIMGAVFLSFLIVFKDW